MAARRSRRLGAKRAGSLLLAVPLAVLPAAGALAQIGPFSAPDYVNDYGSDDDGVMMPASADRFPELAVSGTTAIAVWSAHRLPGSAPVPDRDIAAARSTDGGATWSTSVGVSEITLGDDTNAFVASDGAGTWVACWSSNDDASGSAGPDADVYYARSTDDGQSWSAPALLQLNGTSDAGADLEPVVAGSAAGTWVAVWNSTEDLDGALGADRDLLFARSTDGGANWGAPAALHSYAAGDSAFDDDASLATDGAGTWIAIWRTDFDPGAIGSDFDLLIARSTDDGATWSAPVAVNSDADSDVGLDVSPQIASDGSGVWVSVWSSTETDIAGRDIHAARSVDAGVTWSTQVDVSQPDVGSDVDPDLAFGGGRWLTVWKAAGNVHLSYSEDAGQSWSTPEQVDAAPSPYGIEFHPKVVTDGLDRVVVIWEANDVPHPNGTEQDVFAAIAPIPPVPSLSPLGRAGLLVATFWIARRARTTGRIRRSQPFSSPSRPRVPRVRARAP